MCRRAAIAVAVMMLASGSAAADPSAADIVRAADHVRNPDKPFETTATIIDYHSGVPKDRTVFGVYSKLDPATGQFRDVIVYVDPPRDAGKILLLNDQNYWFYDPASKASIRISPQERLTGEASAGDVVSENLAIDYRASLAGTETIADANRQQRDCWRLDLSAADAAATYNRVEYWIERGTYFPIKARFYADSGQLLKTLYYRNFVPAVDRVRPAQAVIVDAVDSTLVTTIDFGAVHFRDIPEAWFQRAYLPHLSIQ